MDDRKTVSSVEEAEAHFSETPDVAVLAVKEGEEKEVYSLDDAKEFFEAPAEEAPAEETPAEAEEEEAA